MGKIFETTVEKGSAILTLHNEKKVCVNAAKLKISKTSVLSAIKRTDKVEVIKTFLDRKAKSYINKRRPFYC